MEHSLVDVLFFAQIVLEEGDVSLPLLFGSIIKAWCKSDGLFVPLFSFGLWVYQRVHPKG
jgi:hypothetical protein